MTHLVIMAAGTGGHIIPGLAVAREMKARGWTVSWLGTTTGMETQLVPKAGLPLDTIAFAGLRGKGLFGWLTGGLRLQKAFWDCRRILRQRAADVVLGMGGYVCFPGGLMAAALGKPLMLVNADAGCCCRTSGCCRWPTAWPSASTALRRRARRTPSSPATRCAPRSKRCGRRNSASPAAAGRCAAGRRRQPGGARAQRPLPAALALIPAGQRPQVTHQTGNAHLADVKPPTTKPACRPRCCPSSRTWPRGWPPAT
jgi:UDP-N-acetylglucosamine--N-acetylmuramyl-(pentapeptide) pyrophosphoryl-undecaprenol N-acetylglucosamine transferase